MTTVKFSPARRLRGAVTPPADKSISHRAAIIGAMASEPVRVVNYLDAADTRSTLEAVGRVGALVERHDGEVLIRGCGMRNGRVSLRSKYNNRQNGFSQIERISTGVRTPLTSVSLRPHSGLP